MPMFDQENNGNPRLVHLHCPRLILIKCVQNPLEICVGLRVEAVETFPHIILKPTSLDLGLIGQWKHTIRSSPHPASQSFVCVDLCTNLFSHFYLQRKNDRNKGNTICQWSVSSHLLAVALHLGLLQIHLGSHIGCHRNQTLGSHRWNWNCIWSWYKLSVSYKNKIVGTTTQCLASKLQMQNSLIRRLIMFLFWLVGI